MEATIQEAIYLFEMKGKFNEASSLLERVAKEGDKKDKEQANFYLGKIHELSNNRQSANFYYKQSLSFANETEMAYWLSEREAITSNQPERFLQESKVLSSPIKKIFGQSPTYLQLQNGKIQKISSAGLQDISVDFNSETEVFQINPSGIWYTQSDEDSLHFISFHSGKQNHNYDIFNVAGFFEQENRVIVQEEQSLSLISPSGTKISIPEKYNKCNIEGFYSPTRSFVLNCPDNSLHLIFAETGVETRVISQFDAITKVLIDKKNIYLAAGNFLYCYFPKNGSIPLWKKSVGSIEDIISFENNIAILESSGRLSLFDKRNGFIKSSVLTDATLITPLSLGTLGLFTPEGGIISVDTLLHPLWFYSFLKPIETKPIFTEDAIYLNFGDKKLQAISPRYYGKKQLQSGIYAKKAAAMIDADQWDSLTSILDTLFEMEPGNAEGWFLKALLLEHQEREKKEIQQTWAEAVRLSISNPRISQTILDRYGKSIGAKFVTPLPISPKTRYPQFFSGKKNLYTLDPAAGQLFCINPENGSINWVKNIGKLDFNPVIGYDESTIAIATKYSLSLYELTKTSSPITHQLPGKAFDIKVEDHSIYVSTWNGFLTKINRSNNKQAWSRKIFSSPFFIERTGDKIHLCNLEGTLLSVMESSGDPIDNSSKKIASNISHMAQGDNILVFANNNNRIFIHNLKYPENAPQQILTDSPISDMRIINNHGRKNILVSLANQSILLYSETGASLWKFQGKSSVFTKPFVKGDEVWIDQGTEIISISIKDGTIDKRYNTPSGSGTPIIINNTLYSASPKRILYGFSL